MSLLNDLWISYWDANVFSEVEYLDIPDSRQPPVMNSTPLSSSVLRENVNIPFKTINSVLIVTEAAHSSLYPCTGS